MKAPKGSNVGLVTAFCSVKNTYSTNSAPKELKGFFRPKATRLVVNLDNVAVTDPILNVRAFVLHDKSSAQRYP